MSDLIYREATLNDIEKIRQSMQMMDDTHRASTIMQGMWLCEKAVRNQPPAHQEPLTEEDYIELRDRFGEFVEYVVRDMITGKGERWK